MTFMMFSNSEKMLGKNLFHNLCAVILITSSLASFAH